MPLLQPNDRGVGPRRWADRTASLGPQRWSLCHASRRGGPPQFSQPGLPSC